MVGPDDPSQWIDVLEGGDCSGGRWSVTVVLLPSLGCRVLNTDFSLGYCGVGGASLANRLDAGKRHAVWWAPYSGRIYEKTRFSSLAETGFSVVVSQLQNAPVVLVLSRLCPRVRLLLAVLSSYQHNRCDVPIPHQSRYDIVLTSSSNSPGKGRGCADLSL